MVGLDTVASMWCIFLVLRHREQSDPLEVALHIKSGTKILRTNLNIDVYHYCYTL